MHDHKHEHTHANMSLALTHNIGLPRVLARPCKQAEAVSMGINVNRRDIPVVVRAVAMANPYLIPQAAFSVCDYMHVSMSVSCEHTKGTRGIIFLSFVVHSLFPLNYTHSLSHTHTHTHTSIKYCFSRFREIRSTRLCGTNVRQTTLRVGR